MTGNSFGIDLYWLPLGAGGNFVRLNGRAYEAVEAAVQRRLVAAARQPAWNPESSAAIAAGSISTG